MADWKIAGDGKTIINGAGTIAQLPKPRKHIACMIAAAPLMYQALRTIERRLLKENALSNGTQRMSGELAELLSKTIAPAVDLAGCKPWAMKPKRKRGRKAV